MADPHQTDLEDFLDPQHAPDLIGPHLPKDHPSRVKGLRRQGAALVISADDSDDPVAEHDDRLPAHIAESLFGPLKKRG